MEKNAKIGTFFYKERKRTQRLERSFEKNGCPTLQICNTFTDWRAMIRVKESLYPKKQAMLLISGLKNYTAILIV